jgi:ribose transport system ATP-binding protein
MRKEILRMNHVVYAENGQPLLNDLSMQVFEGEIYGILRLERHGGAELFRLITWNEKILSGQVYFREQLVNSVETGAVTRNKVTVIDGHSRLIDSLSLADNLFVIRPGFRKFYLRKRALEAQTKRLQDKYDIHLPQSAVVGQYQTYDRLVAELLRAIVAGDRLVLLVDIPDLLGQEELLEFHGLLKRLTGFGMTFLYVYNHHETLRQLCDRVAIFKEGRIVKTVEQSESLSQHVKVFAKPAYEELSQLKPRKNRNADKPVILCLDKVCWGGIKEFSMEVRAGENLLLIDRDNTVPDILMDFFEHLNHGETMPGVTAYKDPKSLRLGIIQRSAPRTTLFPDMSFLDNLCFSLGEKVPSIWRKRRLRKSVAREYGGELGDLLNKKHLYSLHTRELYTLAYYRQLIAKPDLVVCIQPLSGLDMYLRPYILHLITKLRDSGIPVLLLSTNLYDTIYVADRILWVEDGKIMMEKTRDQFQEIRQFTQDFFSD